MELIDHCVIDVAVLCQEFTEVEINCNNKNTVNLDEIEIKKIDFCKIFYPNGDKFGIKKETAEDIRLLPFISFLPDFRRIKGKKFFLLEEILSNIENDLNISRNCFTTSSRIELANEFLNLKSLSDLNGCSVITSLSWKNILDILNSYESNLNKIVIPIFCVSIVFKTPTPNVNDTIIKFSFRIID